MLPHVLKHTAPQETKEQDSLSKSSGPSALVSWSSLLTLNNFNSFRFLSDGEEKYFPRERRLDDCGGVCIHPKLAGDQGVPRGPEAARGNIFSHFSACFSLHLSAILPQRRAHLPSWAWLYRGSHTGRCLCSSVPATTVSPACPRTSKGVRVSMGPDKTDKNQEISWSPEDKGKCKFLEVDGAHLSVPYLNGCALSSKDAQ